ncbi:hypothetical protein FO519_005858 [Halicephalobus sp. NKZ332]|nr:hypothetical protein FO519_005858 [Halicephalobus sp. NKZ332]
MLNLPIEKLFVCVFFISACSSLEFSRGKNGDTWNAWGNGDDKNEDSFGIRITNEADVEKKSNFRPTISRPSQPVTCHPDHNPCENPNSECQFSFSSFQYICCQDRDDVKPPECPKYHVTLRTLCGGINDASCPRSYKCLPSRFDPNIEICCKPNSSIFYPEPDTSFRDNVIVPEHLLFSPKTTVKLQFQSLEMAMGQLISNDDVEDLLLQPPTITGFQGDESKLYTLVLFGKHYYRYPRNAPAFIKEPNKAILYWLVNNVTPFNGTLYQLGSKRSSGKDAFPYVKPPRDEKPYGIHTMVLVVFEQKGEIIGKTEIRVNQLSHEFVIKQWVDDFSAEIEVVPVAGNFYGFTSANTE